MFLRKILYCFAVIVVANITLLAQQFEQTSILGARNAGLGDADISSANDISGMYQNPATTVFMKESSVFVNHAAIRGAMGMDENIAFPVLPKGPQMVAFGFEIYHLGYLEQPSSLKGQHVIEYGYDVDLSTELTSTLSVGALAGLRDGLTNNSQAWAANYSLGIDYTPSANINYAAVFKGLGNDIVYEQNDTVINASSNLLPNSLEIGASMSYPTSSSLRRQVFLLTLANEKVFGITGLYYKVGVEIRPLNFLGLRFGYVTGPHVNEPRFGVGFQYENFRIDYVYYTNVGSNMLQQFSFSYVFY